VVLPAPFGPSRPTTSRRTVALLDADGAPGDELSRLGLALDVLRFEEVAAEREVVLVDPDAAREDEAPPLPFGDDLGLVGLDLDRRVALELSQAEPRVDAVGRLLVVGRRARRRRTGRGGARGLRRGLGLGIRRHLEGSPARSQRIGLGRHRRRRVDALGVGPGQGIAPEITHDRRGQLIEGRAETGTGGNMDRVAEELGARVSGSNDRLDLPRLGPGRGSLDPADDHVVDRRLGGPGPDRVRSRIERALRDEAPRREQALDAETREALGELLGDRLAVPLARERRDRDPQARLGRTQRRPRVGPGGSGRHRERDCQRRSQRDDERKQGAHGSCTTEAPPSRRKRCSSTKYRKPPPR
jgi:hypothetical protein